MSNGKTLLGQLLRGVLQIPVSFTQRMEDKRTADARIGDAHTEINPVDEDASQVRVFSLTAEAITFVTSYFRSIPGETDIELPPVLKDLAVTYDTSTGTGAYDETVVSTGAVGCSASGSAEASASVAPKLTYNIEQKDGSNLPVLNCYFFMAEGSTRANILTRLSAALSVTVNDWPRFTKVGLKFSLTSARVAKSARVAFAGSDSTGGSYESLGEGESTDVSQSKQVEFIPPTLHAAFSLSGSSSASAAADGEITATGVITGNPIVSASASATGRCAPSSVAATSPTGLPTSGLYLYRILAEPNEDVPGYYMVRAIVLDFSIV